MFRLFKHEQRLRELEESLDKLKRSMDGLQLEWAEVLDRVKRLMGRIAKRAEIDAEASSQEKAAQGMDPSKHDVVAPPGIDPVSAKILTRRHYRSLLATLSRRSHNPEGGSTE